jgi:glycosyltransferase involved in cell wall biosynthesis
MTQNRCRVLHVVGTMNPGGLETLLLQVLADIDRDAFQFDFCICGSEAGAYAGKVQKLGGSVLMCPRSPSLLSFRRGFQRILQDGKYDVVHSHVCFFSGALLRWASEKNVPIRIAHSHNADDGKSKSLSRHLYRNMMKSWIDRFATHGLAASKVAAAELFGKNWQSDERFQILEYGLELSPFQKPIDPAEVRAEFGIPTVSPVIGHVGRFDRAKNHRFLLEIADAIHKTRPDIHFLLVGDGPLRSEIESQARARNLSNIVHFTGVRTDVPRLMLGAMDLFLFPSFNEGFGFSLLEAQAAGLRCLVADTVPTEAVRISEAVEFLPLSAGRDSWSATVIQNINSRQSRTSPHVNLQTGSKFSMRRSLQNLTSIYSTAPHALLPETIEQHV